VVSGAQVCHNGSMEIRRTDREGDRDQSWSLQTDLDRTVGRILWVVVIVAIAVALWLIGFPYQFSSLLSL
jgi:hypothetical protein